MKNRSHKKDDSQAGILQAALAGDEAKMQEAIELGEDINAWDENGMTPLLTAVFIGDPETVRLLLKAGADPNRASREDPTATPLWHAKDDFGLNEITDLLISAGAKDETSA